MDFVFTNYDILSKILENVDIFTLNAIASVSKLFNKINVDMYNKKLKSTIIEPANINFKNYIISIQPTIDLINLHNANNYHILISDEDLYSLMIYMNNLLESFLKTTLWIALVNDFMLMENLFCHLANIEIFLQYVRKYNLNNVNKELEQKLIKNLQSIKQYLYIENFDFYTVEDLKILCKFKNIKKYYKLKRIHLTKALTRPKNELYYLND